MAIGIKLSRAAPRLRFLWGQNICFSQCGPRGRHEFSAGAVRIGGSRLNLSGRLSSGREELSIARPWMDLAIQCQLAECETEGNTMEGSDAVW